MSEGKTNVIAKAAFCTCLLLGVALAGVGQSRRKNLKKCVSSAPDTVIAGCTALIQAGRESSTSLVGAYVRRGSAYFYKSDYDRAIQDYNEAIHLNPSFAKAYINRGVVYIDKGDYDLAIQDYGNAIRLSPKGAIAYYNRGGAYIDKSDYEHAIQDLNEAIHRKPNFADAYENRGDAYLFKSNLTAAIADFEHVISAAPSSNTAVYAALMLHVAMKRQGLDDAPQLAAVAAAADLSKWPGLVLKLDLGQMTSDEVMAAAANTDAEVQKRQVCGANYFTGEDALLNDRPTTALARFKAARDGCPKGDIGYAEALAELRRLGAPGAPAK